MTLPVAPPVAPMLARLEDRLPEGPEWVYEPKWDGFRCLLFRDGDTVDLRSRNDRQLARYFPEVVDAALAVTAPVWVADGELIVVTESGADFPALLARLHPARSRVRELAERTPAVFVGFDLLAHGHVDLLGTPFGTRRHALEQVLADGSERPDRAAPTPQTDAPGAAQEWLDAPPRSGVDGVVARRTQDVYAPGKRALVKVKRHRSVDCVVAGFRVHGSDPASVSSLLLGLYDAEGSLHHVGIAAGFRSADRAALLERLRPLVTDLSGHPWENGFGLEGGALGRLKGTAGRWTPDMQRDWVPLRPELVVEVGYDHVEGHRFRHPGRLLRWRPDRSPRTCLLEQLRTGR